MKVYELIGQLLRLDPELEVTTCDSCYVSVDDTFTTIDEVEVIGGNKAVLKPGRF